MIVTIAEHFTSDPSDRERSPTIIWKPGLNITDCLNSDFKTIIHYVKFYKVQRTGNWKMPMKKRIFNERVAAVFESSLKCRK